MRNTTTGLIVALACVLGLFVGANWPTRTINAEPAPTVKWEYKVINGESVGKLADPKLDGWESIKLDPQTKGLNKFAEEGWELVEVVIPRTSFPEAYYYLRRPAKDK